MAEPPRYIPQAHQERFHASTAPAKLMLAGVGAGKALALDTPIPTPSGWTTMGELHPGDLVLDRDGAPCAVKFATPVQYGRLCYLVQFDDGSTIVADADHLWVTSDRAARRALNRRCSARPQVRTTAEIAASARVGKRRVTNHSIGTCGVLRLGTRYLPVPPYTLGYWLGNGCNYNASVSLHDDDLEVLELIAADGFQSKEIPSSRKSSTASYTIGGTSPRRNSKSGQYESGGGLFADLRRLGLLCNKHIPRAYLRASASQRRALLAGLMDSDGHAAPRGNTVEFCSTRWELASGVHELACSLGMKASIAHGRAKLNGRDMGVKWRVTWSTRECVFQLSRKAAMVRPGAAQKTRCTTRYIIAVDEVPSVPVKCIQVDSPSHTYLAGRSMIPTHNTLTGVHEAVFLLQDNPECDGAIASPTYQMLRDVILPLWTDWIPEQLYTLNKSDQQITWHPTGRKIFLRSADKPYRLDGLNVGWAWLDEAAQLSSAAVWNRLQARIRDPRARRKCLYTTTTPEGLNWLIREFRNPGLEGFVVRAKTSDNRALDPDFERRLRATYGDEYAKQYLDAEVLQLQGLAWPYMPQVHSALSLEEMAARCLEYYGGVDWGFTNPSALVVGGRDSDGRWHLVEEWYASGVDREVVAAAAKRLNARWNVRCWYSDHDPEGVRHLRQATPDEVAAGIRGCVVRLARKDVAPGVQFVRTFFPVRNDGEPRIYVHESLRNWRREVDAYAFPPGKEVPIGGNGDHALDATRYLLYSSGEKARSGLAIPSLTQVNEWA